MWSYEKKINKNISNILLYQAMLSFYSKCRKTQSIKGILLLIREVWGTKNQEFIRRKKQMCIFFKLKFKTILCKMLALDDILFWDKKRMKE